MQLHKRFPSAMLPIPVRLRHKTAKGRPEPPIPKVLGFHVVDFLLRDTVPDPFQNGEENPLHWEDDVPPDEPLELLIISECPPRTGRRGGVGFVGGVKERVNFELIFVEELDDAGRSDEDGVRRFGWDFSESGVKRAMSGGRVTSSGG